VGEIIVNRRRYEVSGADEAMSLLRYLRETLGLTGTKNGCEEGVCGACTVIVDGAPRRSCRLKVSDVLDREILTIEGMEMEDGRLHPIQEAFVEAGAIQCGFCTPGMVMTTYAFLFKNPSPTREAIRKALSGNLCRCTGYQQIVDAVELAARKMRKTGFVVRGLSAEEERT